MTGWITIAGRCRRNIAANGPVQIAEFGPTGRRTQHGGSLVLPGGA